MFIYIYYIKLIILINEKINDSGHGGNIVTGLTQDYAFSYAITFS